MNQISVIELSNGDVFESIALEPKEHYTRRFGAFDTQLGQESCVEPLNGMPSTGMQVKQAEVASRKPIKLRENALVL